MGSHISLFNAKNGPDCAVSTRTRTHLESQAIMCFAGDAAENKFNARRRFCGHSDYSNAFDLLEYISTSLEQCEARLKVAYVGAQDLIEDNWPSVQTVAEELLRTRTLSANKLANLVLPRWLRDNLPLGTVFRHGP